MSRDRNSADSMIAATKSRARFSGHGQSKGAAGITGEGETQGEFLSTVGETAIVNPQEHGFQKIRIGAAWDNVPPDKAGFFTKMLNKTRNKGVDLDLGCLYELHDGKRGVVQAFGDLFGSYDQPPYITLSGDERTGDAEGDDEFIQVNGKHWGDIKRLLLYIYIYDGAPDWSVIRPQIHVDVPGEPPLVIVPSVHRSELSLCALAGMENIRNGIRLTNYTEYFPGHSEMDRAFGFGLQWADGQKL